MTAVQAPPARRRPASLSRAREQAMLRRYAVTRDPSLREQLVQSFLPLARSLALRYRGRAETLEDVIQVANVGLIKAIDGFDPDRGRPFPAYATPTILGEVRRHFRDHVWTVRLPRGLQELTMRLDGAATALTEELGRSPKTDEIAERLGVSGEAVLEALEAGHARRTLSLDAPRAGDEDSVPAVETVADAELGYDRIEADLASQRAGLDEREWKVLRMRFVDQLTQWEIGDELGVSQMQISRISRRALHKLLGAVQGQEVAADAP